MKNKNVCVLSFGLLAICGAAVPTEAFARGFSAIAGVVSFSCATAPRETVTRAANYVSVTHYSGLSYEYGHLEFLPRDGGGYTIYQCQTHRTSSEGGYLEITYSDGRVFREQLQQQQQAQQASQNCEDLETPRMDSFEEAIETARKMIEGENHGDCEVTFAAPPPFSIQLRQQQQQPQLQQQRQ